MSHPMSHPKSHTASFECLENRRLFSGASVAHGVLRVHGDVTNHNIITVNNSTDGKSVNVSISWVTPSHVKKNFSAEVPKSLAFTKINIFGGIRADTVNVGLINGALGIKTRIETGRGDDTIATGSEADVIYAGRGNDSVFAGSGADLIYGGRGNDNLSGEAGNDTLWGGRGDDIIDGGANDDQLGGILGTNTLLGRAGKDSFLVKSLSANPTNDYNASEDLLVVKVQANDVDAPDGVAV